MFHLCCPNYEVLKVEGGWGVIKHLKRSENKNFQDFQFLSVRYIQNDFTAGFEIGLYWSFLEQLTQRSVVPISFPLPPK